MYTSFFTPVFHTLEVQTGVLSETSRHFPPNKTSDLLMTGVTNRSQEPSEGDGSIKFPT